MIGLDTNVMLRVFEGSDAAQTRRAEQTIKQESEACLINPIVLCEFAWTLDRTYAVERPVIADHLDRILQAPEFIVPFDAAATAAVGRYRKGPADFADYYLSEINRALGCTTTATFDRDAGKDENFTLLKA